MDGAARRLGGQDLRVCGRCAGWHGGCSADRTGPVGRGADPVAADPPTGRRPPAAAHRPARRAAPRRRPARPGRRHHLRQRRARRAGRVGRPGRDAAAGRRAGRRPRSAGSAGGRAAAGVAVGFGARFDARQQQVHRESTRFWPQALGTVAVGDGRLAAAPRPGRRARTGCAWSTTPRPPTWPTPSTRSGAALAAGRPVPLLVGGVRAAALRARARPVSDGRLAGLRADQRPGPAASTPDLVRRRALAPVLGLRPAARGAAAAAVTPRPQTGRGPLVDLPGDRHPPTAHCRPARPVDPGRGRGRHVPALGGRRLLHRRRARATSRRTASSSRRRTSPAACTSGTPSSTR